MKMATLSMIPVRNRNRFQVHFVNKSCGNCGLWLYEDDEIIHIDGKWSPSDSGYYHSDYHGCQKANDAFEGRRFTGVGKVVISGQS